MAKGSTGTETNVLVILEKPDRIPCDCERCYHSKKRGELIYCAYYDIFSPKRKTCVRYYCVKPKPKKKKKSAKKKKETKLIKWGIEESNKIMLD